MSSILVAHPSADQYGSDLQLLETISAFRSAGHEVTVLLPSDGPLVPLLIERGAEVRFLDFPILRKSLLSLKGIFTLGWWTLRTLPGMWRELRHPARFETLWINTITMPSWFVLGRIARVRTITHVHEAENDGPRWARWGLTAPTALSHRIVTNSAAAAEALTSLMPRLGSKITVVHNGMPGPPEPPSPPRGRTAKESATIALVARLSPRKGIDVALDAIALLREQGRDVHLRVCGTVFEGYEWYEAELQTRAAEPDLAGSVEFMGYVNPTWPVLAGADVVLVPSRVEPFGNTAVETLLAQRPLIASATQGLVEILKDGETGLLVTPDDPAALGSAIARLLDDPPFAAEMARRGRIDAETRFSTKAYSTAILAILTE